MPNIKPVNERERNHGEIGMSAIQTLPPEVSSRIAAGEVIERPLSVVKELLDNAVDARSSRIVIDLAEGGKSLIRVEDDGHGIPAAELPVSAENFSTSKIRGGGRSPDAVARPEMHHRRAMRP